MTQALDLRPALVTVDPLTDPRWAALVERSPQATLFHSPPWLRAVARTYDLTPEATILVEGDTARAGLVHARIEDARGARLVAFPFSDFTDPLVTSDAEWHQLSAALLAASAPFTIRVRQSPWTLEDPRLQVDELGYWHAVEVAPDADAQWASLGGSARRNIRRAQQRGVTVDAGASTSQVRDFFDLHRQVRKYKYRLLTQPWAFFEQLIDSFAAQDRLHVLLARVDGQPVGGIFAIAWGDSLYYKFNASALDELEVRPNDLLAWEAIALARRLGLARMDFGFSDGDQLGLVRYKRKFATIESRVHRASRVTSPPAAAAVALGRDLQALTRLLTDDRVPDDVTEAAGALLYRYFA